MGTSTSSLLGTGASVQYPAQDSKKWATDTMSAASSLRRQSGLRLSLHDFGHMVRHVHVSTLGERPPGAFPMLYDSSTTSQHALRSRLAARRMGPYIPPGGFLALPDYQYDRIADPRERRAAVPLPVATFLLEAGALHGPMRTCAGLMAVEGVLEDLEHARQIQGAREHALGRVRVTSVPPGHRLVLVLNQQEIAACGWWGKVRQGNSVQILVYLRAERPPAHSHGRNPGGARRSPAAPPVSELSYVCSACTAYDSGMTVVQASAEACSVAKSVIESGWACLARVVNVPPEKVHRAHRIVPWAVMKALQVEHEHEHEESSGAGAAGKGTSVLGAFRAMQDAMGMRSSSSSSSTAAQASSAAGSSMRRGGNIQAMQAAMYAQKDEAIPEHALKLIARTARALTRRVLLPDAGCLPRVQSMHSLRLEGAAALREASLPYGHLNERQLAAIGMCLQRNPLSVLFGPPGTGKTTTLASFLALQLRRKVRAPRVLLVSTSNIAVELALTKALRHTADGQQPWERWMQSEGVLRVASMGRTGTDTASEQGSQAARAMQKVAVSGSVPLDALAKKRLVVATMDTAARWIFDVLGAVYEGKRGVGRWAGRVTYSKAVRERLQAFAFDYVVVDEASQARTSQLLPVLMAVYLAKEVLQGGSAGGGGSKARGGGRGRGRGRGTGRDRGRQTAAPAEEGGISSRTRAGKRMQQQQVPAHAQAHAPAVRVKRESPRAGAVHGSRAYGDDEEENDDDGDVDDAGALHDDALAREMHLPTLVLAGDPMQLGPVIHDRVADAAGAGVSLMERLLGADVSGMAKLGRSTVAAVVRAISKVHGIAIQEIQRGIAARSTAGAHVSAASAAGGWPVGAGLSDPSKLQVNYSKVAKLAGIGPPVVIQLNESFRAVPQLTSLWSEVSYGGSVHAVKYVGPRFGAAATSSSHASAGYGTGYVTGAGAHGGAWSHSSYAASSSSSSSSSSYSYSSAPGSMVLSAASRMGRDDTAQSGRCYRIQAALSRLLHRASAPAQPLRSVHDHHMSVDRAYRVPGLSLPEFSSLRIEESSGGMQALHAAVGEMARQSGGLHSSQDRRPQGSLAAHLLDRCFQLDPAIGRAVLAAAHTAVLHGMPARAPLVVFGIDGSCVSSQGTRSKENKKEAEEVSNVLAGVAAEAGGIDQLSASVVTPYAGQQSRVRELIRGRFGEAGLDAVRVGTVDGVQGTEADLVVISTVRSMPRVTSAGARAGASDAAAAAATAGAGPLSSSEDQDTGLGFLVNPRRTNVAISRAKFGLAIVCDPRALMHDPHWAACVALAACTGYLSLPYQGFMAAGARGSESAQRAARAGAPSQASASESASASSGSTGKKAAKKLSPWADFIVDLIRGIPHSSSTGVLLTDIGSRYKELHNKRLADALKKKKKGQSSKLRSIMSELVSSGMLAPCKRGSQQAWKLKAAPEQASQAGSKAGSKRGRQESAESHDARYDSKRARVDAPAPAPVPAPAPAPSPAPAPVQSFSDKIKSMMGTSAWTVSTIAQQYNKRTGQGLKAAVRGAYSMTIQAMLEDMACEGELGSDGHHDMRLRQYWVLEDEEEESEEESEKEREKEQEEEYEEEDEDDDYLDQLEGAVLDLLHSDQWTCSDIGQEYNRQHGGRLSDAVYDAYNMSARELLEDLAKRGYLWHDGNGDANHRLYWIAPDEDSESESESESEDYSDNESGSYSLEEHLMDLYDGRRLTADELMDEFYDANRESLVDAIAEVYDDTSVIDLLDRMVDDGDLYWDGNEDTYCRQYWVTE